MKTPEEKRKMSKGEIPMHLKVNQMSHLILERHFPLNCYGMGREYFEYPEVYYIDEHPENNDCGSILCLQSGLNVCIELQSNIIKVSYTHRTNQPFTPSMLEQKAKIETLFKEYLDIE